MFRRWYWSGSRGLSFSWSCWGFPLGWLDVVTIFQVISSSSWSLVQRQEPSQPQLTRSWDWRLDDREWPLRGEKLMLKKMVLVCRSRDRMACFVFLVFVLSESVFTAELGLKWIQSVTLFYPWNTLFIFLSNNIQSNSKVSVKGSSHPLKTIKKGTIVPFGRSPPLNG